MRFLFFLLLLIVVPAGAAWAAPEPTVAPAGAWVERIPVAEPDPAQADRPFQSLLLTAQALYGPDHDDHYTEAAVLVQSVQGLQVGQIAIPWQPDQSELIIHKVHILRGGTVVDLLADGGSFTVLRRENNLESAMLDGVLTAVMQAEGLAVGDVLNIAYTIRRRGGILPLRGENLFVAVPGFPLRRLHLRQIWPDDAPMYWRASGVFERARARRTRLGTELVVDLTDVEGPQPPPQAPPRFLLPASLQITAFRDWAEISAMLAPHYEQARQLAPSSPLRAQIERIAASTQDPRARTMAALRLVQDEIRYVAVMMGDGNFLPATADRTWSRRYGDCKAKTVTLLALLHGLGIDAEPVLVNLAAGDSLGERLPQMAMFDHVIVRVRLDGRSYWLDGTRAGDRTLEDLESSPLRWGLPIRAAGAALERIDYLPPTNPNSEVNVTYDGSAGLDGPVPIRIERVFRGDVANLWRTSLAQQGREQFMIQLRENESDLPGDEDELISVDYRDDDATGTFMVIVTGRTRMPWYAAPGSSAQRYRFDDGTIDWQLDLDRPAGPYRDAPYAFPVPAHFVSTETVILPNGGAGFEIDGPNFDRVVAGARMSRQAAISGGRAVVRWQFQRLTPEIPAEEARASAEPLREVVENEAYLRAPGGVFRRAGTTAEPRREPSDSASDLVESGFRKMGNGQMRPALADFDRAIELAPDWARPHGNRGIALIHLGRLDEAEAALEAARHRDDTDFVVHQGFGYLLLERDRPEQALAPIARSLELDPDNSFTLGLRTEAFERLGRFEDALATLAEILRAEPRHAFAHSRRARLLAHLGREEEALAAIDAAVAADPANFQFAVERGDLLNRLGRREEAATAYQAALATMDRDLGAIAGSTESFVPIERLRLLSRAGRHAEAIASADRFLRRFAGNVMMLGARCLVRAEAGIELERALRDCNEALEQDSGFDAAKAARALIYLRLERWPEAIRDFGAILAAEPRRADALFGRGIARLRSGDRTRGTADLAAARRYGFDVAAQFERVGIKVPADAMVEAAPAPATPTTGE